MSQPYKNREIDSMRREIMDKLDIIDSKVTKTNNRVNKLEVWRGYLTGGLAVLTALILPIVLALATKIITL